MNSTPSKSIAGEEAGVTLLLSVLILAGLTLISVAVGSFAINELRASRSAVITEPAIGAAEAAGEEGLWAIKRSTSISTCPTQTTETLTNNTVVNSCESFSEATFNIKANVPFVFYLYDPSNINGDTDLSGYPYSLLTITNTGGTNSVGISVTRLDGSTTGISPSSPPSLNSGQTQNINITPVSPGTEGRMQITLLSSGDNTITANTDRGMPTFPTVDATGCASNTSIASCNNSSQEIFSRRINVTVPQ